MVWSTPRLWVAGELVTASMMNTYVSDDLAYLKGSAGTVAIGAGVTVTGTVTSTGAAVTGNTTATGSVTGTGGVYSANWFRATVTGQGVYNDVTATGLGLTASGPTIYTSGDIIVGRTTTETLSNKTLTNPKWSGASGFSTTGNDLTNYMFVYGATTFTLPTANAGTIRFIKAWGGTCTINSTGGTNLAAPGGTAMVSSFSLANGDSLTMISDGTYWWTI